MDTDTPTTNTPTTPYATVADIIRKQNEIERRLRAVERRHHDIAERLDALANGINYLSTSTAEVRGYLRDIAAVLRGEQRD